MRKEYIVVNYLKKFARLSKFKYNEEVVLFGKKKYRPDILYENHDKYIIVEIDEYQHKKYNKLMEIIRTSNLRKYYTSDKALYIIRFNPDKYWHHGKLISTPLAMRLPYLKNHIEKTMKHIPIHKNSCTITEIYYNYPKNEHNILKI